MTEKPTLPIDPDIFHALDVISDFIRQTTGDAPTPAELSNALTRYFVLNEIREHIVMLRDGTIENAE